MASPLPSAADSSPSRRDFLKTEIAAANAWLDPVTRQLKYADMSASAFAFFRATSHLYFKDIQTGVIAIPASWPATPGIAAWAQGDFHTQNVGFYDNCDGDIVFDINDFDEAFPGPFYFDTIRCVAAIHLTRGLTRGWNLSPAEADDIALNSFLAEYQATLESVKGNSGEKTMVLDKNVLTGFVRDMSLRLEARQNNVSLLDKWTTFTAGVRVFNLAHSDLVPLTDADAHEIASGWDSYLASIGGFRQRKPAGYWTIKDRAVRINSGLGSRGVKKYYLLLQGAAAGQDDDIILEVKQSMRPAQIGSIQSASSAQYAAWFGSQHGRRVAIANRVSLSRCDEHTGWLSGPVLSCVVRRVSPWKKTLGPEDLSSKSDYANFIQWTGRALAYAHARSDKDNGAAYIAGNVEGGIVSAIKSTWSGAKTRMRDLGHRYADQVRTDFALFLHLRAEDQI